MQTLKNTIANQSPSPQSPSNSQFLSILIDSFRIYNSDPTPNAYRFVISTLTRCRQFHHLPPLLHRLEKVEKFETPEFIFTNLIKVYGNANMFEDAVDLFFRIPNFRCVPSVYSLNALLYVLCKRREGLVMVPQILLKSQAMNIRLEESSFRILVAALCDEVLRFMEEMRKLGFYPGRVDCNNPDTVSYTMILNGVTADGDYEKADDLFDEMLVLGVVPDIHAYNVYINSLCKQNNIEEGVRMLASMRELGCKPDYVTYNMLLEGMSKVRDLGGMRELAREMELEGVQWNWETYRIMLDGLVGKGEIDESCSLLEEMLDKYFSCWCSTFDEIICELCQRGLVCKALQLVNKMVRKTIAPGARAWEALLLGSVEFSFAETSLTELVNPIQIHPARLPEHQP
ncbi:Pentatricopeptide repeat-containing protein, mitochondrial [Vitis vinifera]|uniref:Pentatricopeptide repeat-containing protein, mitochondrial n=1 Tax=Vitis vinifera TaxID=29760 RepID=A0A438IV78_VITVI|nr:Pentatricopeptide repeat-containing protein, mitochondrial [Vitis vinifera]